MSETISRPKCVQAPAPAIVVEDQIDRVLEQAAAPVQPPVDLPAFTTPTQIGRRLAALRDMLDKLEQTEGCMGASFNRYSKERDSLVDLIFTMQPGNLHDVAAVLSATIDPLGMLEGFNLTRKEIDTYTTQLQHAVCGSLKHLMAHGINVDALAPVDTAYEVQRILGTPAEATPSALRDLADTMERQFVEIRDFPSDKWPGYDGPQVFQEYWANVNATQKQIVQSAEDVVSLARIARTLEDSISDDECPALENIHRMLVSAILDGHLPSPAGRDASIIAKATAATAFGRHVDDAADHFPNDEAGNEALVRLVNKREDMMDDLIRCKPTSLQGFAAMAQAIVESDPGVKEGGEPISDSRHLAAFARHLAAVAPQSGVSPDVALINDCNRFCELEALYTQRFKAAHTYAEEKAAEALNAPMEAEHSALMKRITAQVARTPAGNVARAHAIKLFADDLLEPSERLDCAQNMLAALARDTLAMGASA
ncbi:hypothetical protein CD178_02046 [Komagataeibacter saccharivorans]|uniref:Uncharacterized protein n=1 Tax=Komagataeibacter saccharivorans TaxID=265959 RepID=A0A347WD59_9PROT|nr:hypothetical protein [Komagataeibacter saccharivorans]AXY22802.1 hypothetical protein CD178_02046 [Komagataeibacter saccharivorans]